MYYSIIISLIEVVLVLVPALLGIAYVTIAERKTMASMQRRLGPNFVGRTHSVSSSFKKYYHTSTTDKLINGLYLNRKAPIKPFKDGAAVIKTCEDLLSPSDLKTFFRSIKSKGGIYIFTYKENPEIFYIGRAKNFRNRFKAHLNINLQDKFHIFANAVGWDKFHFSIIQICSLDIQKERENYYLQKYLPLLNTIYKSEMYTIQNYDSLHEILKLKQLEWNKDNKYSGIPVYLYTYSEGSLKDNYIKFESINKLSQYLNISRETINIYLNTYVPYKSNIFLTDLIVDFELIDKLVSDTIQGLDLDRTISKKVWVYSIDTKSNIVKNIYNSIGETIKILNVSHNSVNNHLDKWIPGGIKNNYLFSNELDNLNIERLKEVHFSRKHNNLNVWIYDANTLELIGNFNSIKKAADYFNVDYRSLINHLDTKEAINKGGIFIYLFKNELDTEDLNLLSNKFNKVSNMTTSIWVYKYVDDKLTLINDNKPSYISKLSLSKDLKISVKTINKYLDSNESYKGYYFYSICK